MGRAGGAQDVGVVRIGGEAVTESVIAEVSAVPLTLKAFGRVLLCITIPEVQGFTSTLSNVQGMTLKCIHIFIFTGSFLY